MFRVELPKDRLVDEALKVLVSKVDWRGKGVLKGDWLVPKKLVNLGCLR